MCHTYFAGIVAQVIRAGGAVLAWIGNAFVHLLLTIASRVSSLTMTIMRVSSIQTLAGVSAQSGHGQS